jgi:hypothetical protein
MSLPFFEQISDIHTFVQFKTLRNISSKLGAGKLRFPPSIYNHSNVCFGNRSFESGCNTNFDPESLLIDLQSTNSHEHPTQDTYPTSSSTSSCTSPAQESQQLYAASPSSCDLSPLQLGASNDQCFPEVARLPQFTDTHLDAGNDPAVSSTNTSFPGAATSALSAIILSPTIAGTAAAAAASSAFGWQEPANAPWVWPAGPSHWELPPNATRSIMLSPADPFSDDFAFW